MGWPEWLVKVLEGMGVHGAIIFVLLTYATAATTTIGLLIRHASKVYKYRLEERDRVLAALNKSADAVNAMAEATEERNDLTEDQAELIKAQSIAFEHLRVTIVAQFETIKQNHGVAMDNFGTSSRVVGSIADALRTVHGLIMENRSYVADHVNGVRVLVQDTRSALESNQNARSDALLAELRRSLTDVTVVQRKRQVQSTRPGKKG